MKWVFYVIVFVYMFYRTVYGLKPLENSLIVEPVKYENHLNYLSVGGHGSIICKASNRNQKVEWIDPSGHEVKRYPQNRVFSQEHFVPALRGRAPALVLSFTRAEVYDTGVYQCKSGDSVKNVSFCVIEPSNFENTPDVVAADLGRSITLSCQAKGDPEPRIMWTRNGEIITDEDSSAKYRVMTKYNSQGFEGLLTITSLEPEDNGIYSCVSIQESVQTEECSHTSVFNITLNVNYAPIFESGDDIKFVYSENNQLAEMECSAGGYPVPTYRWFQDLGGNVLHEFDKKQIELIEDQAVLTVMANQSTFGQRYKCLASNEHGVAEKYYSLLKIEKPSKLSAVGAYSVTENSVNLNVTWDDDITQFPVDTFEVQYVKAQTESGKTISPKDISWRKSKMVEIKSPEETTVIDGVIIIGIDDLAADSAYWMRVRAINKVGDSAWSDPVRVETTAEAEPEPTTTEAPEAKPEVANNEESISGGTFYGIFFAGGILVVAFVYMLAMRMVK